MPSTPHRTAWLCGAALLGTLAARATAGEYAPLSEDQIAKLPHVEQKLVPPPEVPEHEQVASGGFKVNVVKMDVEEKQILVDDQGTKMWAFAYNGSVPGPMIVAHEGDYVLFTLVNLATNTFEHNIDFHAATGALGGAELTHVQPGEQATLRFRCTRAGVFLYHCAPGGIMIPWHVTHGMNGVLMVLPRGGLTDGHGKKLHYDKAFYIGEQSYYIKKGKDGKYKSYKTPAEAMGDDLQVMDTLTPSHIVFGDRVGSLTGPRALRSKVGETVLIVHEAAMRDTRPHLIGGHGDYVWERGKFGDVPLTDQETWFVAGGSAGAALYTFLQPGTYAYLNHNLIEAVVKGAAAHIKVEGKWNDDLMKQIAAPAESPKEAPAESKPAAK